MPSFDKFLSHCGWVNDPDSTKAILDSQPRPLFAACSADIKSSGRGKRVLLSDFIYKVLGRFNLRTQEIGDCCSMGAAAGIDVLKAIGCINRGEEWIAETATEPLYSGSRVEILKNKFSGSDGSTGAATALCAKQYGVFLRLKYEDFDFTIYSGKKAREMGETGIPDNIEKYGLDHRVKNISLVTTYYDAIDAINNGYPVTVASNCGFDWKRDNNGKIVKDKDGFLLPKGQWGHQMVFTGFSDNPNRPGLLCQNSWGEFMSGPSQEGQPPGSFFVDAEVAEKYMLSAGDSFAYSEFDGFPPQKLNLRLFSE